ncbi:MAG: class II aldolase/adducin family protein [Lachnospiraceae bacterium]|jgi:L-fuculose-phosphate aldolase|nr:class II aldolase/adducin family protein [Lachnospiraceae bacterium]
MGNEAAIKEEMCEIGKRVYLRGMVAANDGNFSVKLGEGEFLCTPTGVSKGFMTPEYICKIDGEGRLLAANGDFRPTSEMKMHLRVYRERPDVCAVVHAHPMYATSFAIAGLALDKPIIPEAIISLGYVPLAGYGMPTTDEIPDAIGEYLQGFDAVLLANHGALTYGDSLLNAYHKMESVEFYARLLYQAQVLGGAKELDEHEVGRLYQLRRELGIG